MFNKGWFIGATLLIPVVSNAAQPTPYYLRNLNPLIQIYGQQPLESAEIQAPGKQRLQLLWDIANNSITSHNSREAVTLDGESYRYGIVLRRGLDAKTEVGAEFSYVAHRGGIMDNFIEGWHDTFGLTNSDRKGTVANTLLYQYSLDGVTKVRQGGGSGMGDTRLFAKRRLNLTDDPNRPTSLLVSLKLPTGDAKQLYGSGATDLAIGLLGQQNQVWPKKQGHLFGQVGALWLGKGDVLPERQRNGVAFADLGYTAPFYANIDIKLQLDGHTSYYRSDLDQLGKPSALLTVGGTVNFTQKMSLDVGVGENLFSDTTPDFLINLALNWQME